MPEVNGGRSEVEWNPVSIVALACAKACDCNVCRAVVWLAGHALKQEISCERGEMERSEGRNERRDAMATGAAVTNEEELQGA